MRPLATTSLALLSWVIASFATPAAAGVIRGHVHVPGDSAPIEAAAPAYPGRASSLPGAHVMPSGGAKDAVVFVETVPAAADSAVAARPTPRLAQRDQMFEPRVLPVVVGGVVDFPNLDPIYHNVFSVSPVRRFDLGKYPRGQSRRVTFPKPGLINVYCDIHADMAAFILVVPNRAFARPEANGKYALPALPAGHYVLHAWHPDRGDTHTELDVPASGNVTWDVTL